MYKWSLSQRTTARYSTRWGSPYFVFKSTLGLLLTVRVFVCWVFVYMTRFDGPKLKFPFQMRLSIILCIPTYSMQKFYIMLADVIWLVLDKRTSVQSFSTESLSLAVYRSRGLHDGVSVLFASTCICFMLVLWNIYIYIYHTITQNHRTVGGWKGPLWVI